MNDNEAIKYNVKINNGPVNGNVKSSTLDTATRNALDSFMEIREWIFRAGKTKGAADER